jgi:pyruvate ferredoxin oxidoreductase gamma subunit
VFQIRIHGRGGQGVVTAAELLSVAAFDSDLHSQAFPSFGSERTGAPVTAFCRIDQRPIRTREPIAEPDVVIIQDPTLLHQVDVFGGLRPHGKVLINSTRTVADLGLDELLERPEPPTLLAVPGTELAREHLGRALPNAALLGGFAALTGIVSIQGVELAIADRFAGAVAAGNIAAARAAYEFVRDQVGAVTGA